VKPTTIPEKTKIIAADAAAVSVKKRSKLAGPQVAKQTIDTRTGIKYASLAQAVKQSNGFAEYGVNPKIGFGEFKVQRLSGGKTGRYQALSYYDLTHPKQ
jgi:hypothetical protein